MYNFKKNAKVYLVELDSAGTVINQHLLDIYSDVSASQTFDEQGYKRKTLHALTDLHEHAVVNNANPANFSFTTPIRDVITSTAVNGITPAFLRLGSEYSSGNLAYFDLYIQSDNVIYKLTKCVIESMTFNIAMNSVLTVSISGTASKLSKFGNVGAVTIPGTPVVNTFSGQEYGYTRIKSMSASIAGSLLDSIAALSIDLKHDIQWYSNNTINEAITGNMMYPGAYKLQGRTYSGSITQFLTSANVDTISDTSTSSAIVIDIFSSGSTTTPILRFNFPSTVFTRRLNFEELINRVYDFRLNTNTTIVKPIYKGV